MKQLYQRTSTASTTERLDAAVRDAITAHAEENQLGNVLADATTVCETRSVRLQRNGFLARVTGSHDPDREHRTVALLTPHCVVIAVAGDQRGIHVRSARLETISLDLGVGRGVDSGVTVVAQWSGESANQATSAFHLGLGDDQAGRAFSANFRDAVTSAKTR